MFERFYAFAGITGHEEVNSPEAFLKTFAGYTFRNGMYRIHRLEDLPKWTNIVEEAFPRYRGSILVFGYDWLGRQFAENSRTGKILMFEPGTGEVLSVPADFIAFHDEEIAEYSEDSLASEFFAEWFSSENGCEIPHDKCVGYKVPLFRNGRDDLSNLELSDLEVYWTLMGALIAANT